METTIMGDIRIILGYWGCIGVIPLKTRGELKSNARTEARFQPCRRRFAPWRRGRDNLTSHHAIQAISRMGVQFLFP